MAVANFISQILQSGVHVIAIEQEAYNKGKKKGSKSLNQIHEA